VSAILVISVFLVFVATLVILRTKRPQTKSDAAYFPPDARPPRLFAESAAGSSADDKEAREESGKKAAEEFEKSLLSRAAQGDFEVLKEARAVSTEMYRRVFDALVESCGASTDTLRSLADFITRNDNLRASPALAERLVTDWEANPSRASVPRLLRVAALSDDAATFELAMSAVVRARGAGRLAEASAEELRSLFEAEYWLLSSEAKRSGAGFLLKQKLARARRELSTEGRRDNSPAAGDVRRELSAQKERP
jgi:hypothetical protein